MNPHNNILELHVGFKLVDVTYESLRNPSESTGLNSPPTFYNKSKMLAASAASYGGMLKVFPWNLSLGGGGEPKTNNANHNYGKRFDSPVAQASNTNNMKRKRQGSCDSTPSRSPVRPPKKKQELAPRPPASTNVPPVPQPSLPGTPLAKLVVPSQPSTMKEEQHGYGKSSVNALNLHNLPGKQVSTMDQHIPNTTSTTAPNDSQIRETIEMQFNLEILLKHKELRLIDQEIAKCQIALEQIRRCSLIPYPASVGDAENMLHVASGSGPLYGIEATHAAPWGVTDGPYTRHYQRFLLPDSAFGDHLEDDQLEPIRNHTGRESRSSTMLDHGSRLRTQRTSLRSGMQAPPHAETKEEKKPIIVKRASDDKMVKLICLHCRREDFSSAQGFINHCRIAHQQSFASHEAAAAACGEEVDASEIQEIKAEAATPTSATPGQVHPLIRTAPLLSNPTSKRKNQRTTSAPKASKGTTSTPGTPTVPMIEPTPMASDSTPFRPSSDTPRLSNLMKMRGGGGDLAKLVTEVKTNVLTNHEADGEDDVEVETPSTAVPENDSHGQVAGSRLPSRSGMAPRSSGFVPSLLESTAQASGPSKTEHPYGINLGPLTPFDSQSSTQLVDLSPQTTESHPAPSLVSDDGDYGTIHSEDEIPSSAHISDEEDLQIHVEDQEHRTSIEEDSSGQPSSAADVPSVPKQPGPAAATTRRSVTTGRRRKSGVRRGGK